MSKSPYLAGRHFLQIPGPTNVPGRILRAIEKPTIDHRGPDFAHLGQEVLEGIREIFKTLGRYYAGLRHIHHHPGKGGLRLHSLLLL